MKMQPRLALVLLALAAGLVEAQAPQTPDSTPPSGVFSEQMSVRVINVDVIVTDGSGRSVAGLGSDDFEIRVDGKPVPISNFYAEAGGVAVELTPRPPLRIPAVEGRDPSFRPVEEVHDATLRRSHVVILVDHTRLRTTNRKRAFSALRQAVLRLGEDDLVAVVGVEGRLVFYSDFLFDRQAISKILDQVTRVSLRTDVAEIERRLIFGELARGISGGIQARASLATKPQLGARIQAYAAQEYARGIRSLSQIERVVSTLSGLPGRKTLLYLGEGIPTRPGEGLYVEWRNRFAGPERGLRHTDFNTDYTREVGRYDLTQPMQQLATAANRAGVTLYAIDGEPNHGGEIQSALTEQGATSESVSLINENYREPLEYASKATGGRLLTSSGLLADQLGEIASNLRTFYSLGFYPPADWESGSDHDLKVTVKGKGLEVSHRRQIRLPLPDEREAGATVAALIYRSLDNPLKIRATPGQRAVRSDGTAVLPINLEIPIQALEFLPQEGSQAGSLTIYVTTKDQDGDATTVQKIPFHLKIPDDKMEEAKADVAHYPLPLVLRQGDQQVAIGIRDNTSGVFAAVRLDVAQYSRF